jgi:hypothetical protein
MSILKVPSQLQNFTAGYFKQLYNFLVALVASMSAPFATSILTTNATPLALATVPIPAGSTVLFEGTMMAVLGPGQVNGNLAPSFWAFTAGVYRIGAGAVVVSDPTFGNGNHNVPFCNGGEPAGSFGFGLSGDNLVLTASGFVVTEAWTSGHTYTAGDGAATAGQFVTANGNVYVCTTGGTASGVAPAGTGTGLGTGAFFAFVCAGSTVPVMWTVNGTVMTSAT